MCGAIISPNATDPMKFKTVIVLIVSTATIPSLCQGASRAVQSGSFRWNWHATQWAQDTLGSTALLSKDEKRALMHQVLGSVQISNLPEADQKELREDVPNTRFKLIDLNGDGVAEVIAQASGDILCGATGNCTFWVFIREKNQYKMLLQEDGIQGFTVQPTQTGGYRDLVLTRHESADWFDLYSYRFRNGQYRPVGCHEAKWVRMNGDERVELKNPIISKCK